MRKSSQEARDTPLQSDIPQWGGARGTSSTYHIHNPWNVEPLKPSLKRGPRTLTNNHKSEEARASQARPEPGGFLIEHYDLNKCVALLPTVRKLLCSV